MGLFDLAKSIDMENIERLKLLLWTKETEINDVEQEKDFLRQTLGNGTETDRKELDKALKRLDFTISLNKDKIRTIQARLNELTKDLAEKVIFI